MQAGQLKTLMFSSKRTDFTMVPPMLVMCAYLFAACWSQTSIHGMTMWTAFHSLCVERPACSGAHHLQAKQAVDVSGVLSGTRFGSTAKVLLKCKLKYYRISECKTAVQPAFSHMEVRTDCDVHKLRFPMQCPEYGLAQERHHILGSSGEGLMRCAPSCRVI